MDPPWVGISQYMGYDSGQTKPRSSLEYLWVEGLLQQPGAKEISKRATGYSVLKILRLNSDMK